ncbi:MAG: class I SAM-dependent methyltransferase [Deltaproteobacteria bacterium]|jgi:2-polyprenyl-3-methyl-5-hydroxy-6-metoxy-1,4-benzoquinol methylase|nr:class I SAM-dependent methyltransferase [Deltaproteobacteria bacterium]
MSIVKRVVENVYARLLSKNIKDAVATLMDGCCENNDFYKSYLRGNVIRIAADADFISSHLSVNSSVLDIGAVPPLMVELLRKKGFKDLEIADPHPEPFRVYYLKSGVVARKVNLLTMQDEELYGKYDIVCLNEVVEHISGNLLKAIENAINCLKPGGHLFITTPNLRSIWGLVAIIFMSSGLASKPISRVREQYDRSSAKYGYYGHLREYTKKEIIELFESFGLIFKDCMFQKNYMYLGFLTFPIAIIEILFPSWRLFGKYLFEKK